MRAPGGHGVFALRKLTACSGLLAGATASLPGSALCQTRSAFGVGAGSAADVLASPGPPWRKDDDGNGRVRHIPSRRSICRTPAAAHRPRSRIPEPLVATDRAYANQAAGPIRHPGPLAETRAWHCIGQVFAHDARGGACRDPGVPKRTPAEAGKERQGAAMSIRPGGTKGKTASAWFPCRKNLPQRAVPSWPAAKFAQVIGRRPRSACSRKRTVFAP